MKQQRKAIAQWLYDKIISEDYVYQSVVVQEIADEFGEQFTYINENGNPAIDTGVLREFRKLKNDAIMWDRNAFCWHVKTEADSELERLTSELPQFEASELEIPTIEIEIPEIDLSNFESE